MDIVRQARPVSDLSRYARPSRPSPRSSRSSFDVLARHSLDVSTWISLDELASIESYWNITKDKFSNILEGRRRLRMEALRRLRERRKTNNALVESAVDAQVAKLSKPKHNYSAWLVKIVP